MTDASERALAGLAAIEEMIAEARSNLAAGVIVNLAPIQERVAAFCVDIQSDPPEDGGQVQEKIASMIADLTGLAEALQTQQRQLSGAVVRQAAVDGMKTDGGGNGSDGNGDAN